ncbi:MAG TPA: hypothetical protein PK509_18340, partial [Catalimonadaceae bacterium]|nr:hypothetical protein [Catalimonadaceae bacterium]
MGTTTTTVSKTGGETFDYLIVQKTGAFNLQFLSNVTVAASSGNIIQLNNTVTNSGINLNGFDLNLTGTGGNVDLAAGALIRTISGTGNINISGGTKTVTRSATSTLSLATTVTVQLSSGINFGASISTLNGTLSINSGGFVSTNPPLYGLTSTLIYNSGGAYALSSEWTSAIATATVTAGRPGNVTIQNNTDLTMTTTDRSLYRNLDISSGSLSLSAVSGNFWVGGNWTRSAAGATFNQNGRTVQFFSVASGLSTTITRTGGETFGNVTMTKGTLTGLNVNLACDVVINGLLTMTTGVIVIGSNNLTLNGTVAAMTTTNGLSGTANSTLTIGGTTTAFGTVAFITAAQRLGTLSINRTSVPSGTAAVTLNSNLLVDNGSGLNNSSFTISNGVLTVNALMTLTVANTSSTGSNASGYVFTATTGRFAYAVTGAGTNTLTYPLGSSAVTSPSAYRPLVINSLVQSATNTYSAASTAGAGSAVVSAYTAPVVGVSTVRYYPFTITTLANLTSIGSVSLVIGADETPILDNLVISQVISSSWQNLGGTGTPTKTTTGTVSVAAATTYFAFGYNKLTVVYISATGSDASSGQNTTNVPAG